MSNNFFEDNDDSFRDVPEEIYGEVPLAPIPTQQPIYRQNTSVQQPKQMPIKQEIQEHYEESYQEIQDDSQEEDFSVVLSDARLRLELGRLYEILMNHDIFQGTDADERAMRHVQKQIRTFAKEKMEIMLGMKQEIPKDNSITSPFNELEIMTLKALASSANPAIKKQQIEQPKQQIPQKPVTINPIAVKPTSKPQTVIQNPQTKLSQQTKPIQRQSIQPKQKTSQEIELEKSLAKEGITLEEYYKTFPKDYKPLDKPVSEYSEQELRDRLESMKKQHNRQVKNPDAKPMPSFEEQAMIYAQTANMAAGTKGLSTLISAAMSSHKK